MSLNADLRHVIHALSDALDLVGVDDVAHGKRVGIMAAACARVAGLPDDEADFLFDLGLLHDIGVSSTRTHTHLVQLFDWEGSQVHCQVGEALLAGFPPLAAMAQPVRYHHTRWEDLRSPGGAQHVAPQVARQANLIFLVDRVDALSAPHHADNTLLDATADIRSTIAGHSGSYFDPDWVAVFLEASRTEAFWLSLEPRAVQACLLERRDRSCTWPASVVELRQLASIFARIVDAKSPFTAEHSLGVSRLARYLAERLQVSPENCDKLEIAGLLHDLGKLRVPDEILDKPSALDERERRIINTHSFETFQILRNIDGFEAEIAPWAAWHHEEPGGNGYPFHLEGSVLPLEARILRVADIFQAMVQERPYRQGLGVAQVSGFIEALVRQGRIEGRVAGVLLDNVVEAMSVARPVFQDVARIF
ncbi:HD domain-containing phosphohydrolase [Zoogloea sp.]|uniref:HD-GYP domain-containing protein n=1 Tax=Zoogloea sp. TaxID=49181 RepID=UPI0014162B37|nr:MAG: HD domain-containing protein [Zoogloea sp.]